MNAKRTEPWIPAGHPDFKWSPGADVQALWRRYGWTPPSEQRPAQLAVPVKEQSNESR